MNRGTRVVEIRTLCFHSSTSSSTTTFSEFAFMDTSQIKDWIRRGLSIVAAALLTYYGMYWSVLGGGFIYSSIDDIIGAGPPGTNINTDQQVWYGLLAVYYSHYVFFIIGVAFIFLFWKRYAEREYERIIASLLFLLTAPAFFLNILASDNLIRLWVQAALDIIVAICAMYFIIVLSGQRLPGIILNLVKFVIIGILTIFFVVVPLFYAVIWALVQMGMPYDMPRTNSLDPLEYTTSFFGPLEYIVLVFGGLSFLAAAACFISYRARLKKDIELVNSTRLEDRLSAIEIIAKRFSVEIGGLTNDQKTMIVRDQIEIRARRERMIFIGLIIIPIITMVSAILWQQVWGGG